MPLDISLCVHWSVFMRLVSGCECRHRELVLAGLSLAFGGMLGCVHTHRFAEFAGLRPKLPEAACLSGSAPSAAGRSRFPLCAAHTDKHGISRLNSASCQI